MSFRRTCQSIPPCSRGSRKRGGCRATSLPKQRSLSVNKGLTGRRPCHPRDRRRPAFAQARIRVSPRSRARASAGRPVDITRRRTADVVVLELAGRLDGYWSDHLDTTLTEVLQDGNHHIRIDCSQVSYLTSAGIRVLMRFHKELGRINGTFQLVNPSAPVMTVLQITRLDGVLVAAGDQTAAVAQRERPSRGFDHHDVGFEV